MVKIGIEAVKGLLGAVVNVSLYNPLGSKALAVCYRCRTVEERLRVSYVIRLGRAAGIRLFGLVAG